MKLSCLKESFKAFIKLSAVKTGLKTILLLNNLKVSKHESPFRPTTELNTSANNLQLGKYFKYSLFTENSFQTKKHKLLKTTPDVAIFKFSCLTKSPILCIVSFFDNCNFPSLIKLELEYLNQQNVAPILRQ